jgi:hypothetical protein
VPAVPSSLLQPVFVQFAALLPPRPQRSPRSPYVHTFHLLVDPLLSGSKVVRQTPEDHRAQIRHNSARKPAASDDRRWQAFPSSAGRDARLAAMWKRRCSMGFKSPGHIAPSL